MLLANQDFNIIPSSKLCKKEHGIKLRGEIVANGGTHRQMVDEYLCEFMWRQRHMNEDLFSVPIMILIMKILLHNVYKPNLLFLLCLVSSVVFSFWHYQL